MMDKLKKIEKRLVKLYRLQKKLEKQRKKLTKAAGETTKNVSKRFRAKTALPVVTKKSGLPKGLVGKMVIGIVVGTACGVAASWLVKKYQAMNSTAISADAVGDYVDVSGENAYDQASLEELENALLRVENEINEVSAAIERSKE